MLEAARILAKTKTKKNVRFISFTLEEQNPARVLQTRELAKELGLVDDNYRYLSWRSQKLVKEMFRLRVKTLRKGTTNAEAWELIMKELRSKLTEKERKYFELYKKLYSQDTRTTWLGKSALIGSSRWVEKALKEQKKILGVINLETIGYTSARKHSQKSPMGFLTRLFPRYKVNIRKGKGNFIAITADKNSKQLAKTFYRQCRRKTINLPYLCAQIPFLSFEGIAKRARDVLRSDHGPFWRAGIPAIMLTDTANFRYPYYHTRADTIDKLDFDFIKKVTQATIAATMALIKDSKDDSNPQND
ncbi:MAG: M28 family peptidase [Candidatus Heimdallarchaeota archaeon]|nr:M28 family peptidase [Candidatus Heimdallarchaeota archaeon]